MRHLLIYGLVSVTALVCWLLAGRRLVTLVDGVSRARVYDVGLEGVIYDDGILELGGKHLDLRNPAFVRLAEVSLDAGGRAGLESGGQRFPMGPGRPLPHIGRMPRFECTKDAGDEIRFTVEHSRMAWPTFFELNFMTGHAPMWKRNVYLRLRWTKRNRTKLELLWKTEQSYYSQDGWSPPHIEAVLDGLIYIRIVEPELVAVNSEAANAEQNGRAAHD